MSVSVVDDVATILGAVSPTLGQIAKRRMPATPAALVAVIAYGGPPPNAGFGRAGLADEAPGVQVTVRGEAGDETGPEAIAWRAYYALAAVQAQTVGGTLYRMIRPQQTPFLLARDAGAAGGRCVYAFNVLAEREVA